MTKARLKQLVLDYLKARDKAKALYAVADEALSVLAAELKPGDEVRLDDGRVAWLVDPFAEKFVVWAHAGVRRFELKVSEA